MADFYLPNVSITSESTVGPTIATKRGDQVYYKTLSGRSVSMQSTGHNLSSLGKGDCGGPWVLQKSGVEYSLMSDALGQYYLTNPSFSVLSYETHSKKKIEGQGTTAIARSLPTSPEFSGATFIGELREGLPSMIGVSAWREQAKIHRGISSEHLNYQFGWRPLVSEVRSFATAVRDSGKIIRDFHGGSDRTTRVGYTFPEELQSKSVIGFAYRQAAFGTSGTRKAAMSARAERRSWFKGAFTYHVPMGRDLASRLSRFESDANKLLGTRITPEVLWNLAPWSWAADWFGNVGDVMTNVSHIGRDGLVLKYGYMMHSNIRSTQIVGLGKDGGSTRSYSVSKYRLPAHPYSLFGALQPLSAKQYSILAALGINRGTRRG